MNYRAANLRVLRIALAAGVLALSSFNSLQALAQEKQEKPEVRDGQQPVVKIGTVLVTVPVIVTDRYGRFITGMNRSDFGVREDGVSQKIENFSSTEAPFNVALLIDTSRSTQSKLGAIRKAAETFIKQLQPNDRVMIVTFDDKVRFLSNFSSNEVELLKAIKSLKSGYLTSIYDAIHLTITEKMSTIQGRKAIVVLTDGVDTASKLGTFESTLDLVSSSGVICYAVQYETRNVGGPIMSPIFGPNGSSRLFLSNFNTRSGIPQDPAEPGRQPSSRVNSQAPQPIRDRYLIASDFLRGLAVQSGALYIRAENIENTTYAFQRIAIELRNQYTLTYLSTNELRDGKYRSIGVNVNRNDLLVRARLGYRGPKAESAEPETEKKPENPSKH
jgi:Ca-activated chloride channel homolog